MSLNLKAAIVSFTQQGRALADKIAIELEAMGFDTSMRNKEVALKEWTEKSFEEAALVVFVSATGIAVRTIAPFLKGKTKDPAVLVIDDGGNFLISLVSGHIGGANRITRQLSHKIGATPVVTTSTDVNGKLAIDEWAVNNNLLIENMTMAKEVAMEILRGSIIGFVNDTKFHYEIPQDLTATADASIGVHITFRNERVFQRELKLIPRKIVLGIGCRRNTPEEKIDEVVMKKLNEQLIDPSAILRVATIDLKADEVGLIGFCQKIGAEFICYSSEELETAKGDFPPSEFVRKITGTDNVCQRAASLGSGGGQCLFEKYAEDGVTVSAYLLNQ